MPPTGNLHHHCSPAVKRTAARFFGASHMMWWNRFRPRYPRRVNRLTYDDDLFLRMECVLDVPVVNQIVWRFDARPPREAVDEMWRHLAAGPINRRVERVRVPGARDRWTRGSDSLPLAAGDEAIAELDIGEWMQQRAEVSLDPVDGPVWQLASADVAGGGYVLSLVASHVVGDGGALTSAAIAALRGPADPEDFRSSLGDPTRHDLRDAFTQIRLATAGTARALGRTLRSRLTRPKSQPSGHLPSAATQSAGRQKETVAVTPTAFGAFTPSTVAVDCTSQQWSEAASAVGGSPNSLLVGIALGILTASGRIDESDIVKVSLPVSTRTPGDVRANATSGVSIEVDGGGGYRTDLSAVRGDSKRAFAALADSSTSTIFELMKPLMQMLPDAIVEKAAASATAPLCLCSNLGDRGKHLKSVGGISARSVAMRSITQNTTAELLRRTKGGVSVWLNTSGDAITLCVTGLDPDRFPTREHLRALVENEYSRWELAPNFW